MNIGDQITASAASYQINGESMEIPTCVKESGGQSEFQMLLGQCSGDGAKTGLASFLNPLLVHSKRQEKEPQDLCNALAAAYMNPIAMPEITQMQTEEPIAELSLGAAGAATVSQAEADWILPQTQEPATATTQGKDRQTVPNVPDLGQNIESQAEMQMPVCIRPTVMAPTVESVNVRQRPAGIVAEARKTEQETETESCPAIQTGTPVFRGVTEVPVKVGDAPALDTEAADFSHKLAGRIAAAVQNGDQKVKLSLHPEHLGKIEIEMSRDNAGVLHVEMHATTERATGLLAAHSQELGQLLQNDSTPHVRIEIDHRTDGQPYQQDSGQSSGQGRQDARQNRQKQTAGEDFINRLRLGLIPVSGQAS